MRYMTIFRAMEAAHTEARMVERKREWDGIHALIYTAIDSRAVS